MIPLQALSPALAPGAAPSWPAALVAAVAPLHGGVRFGPGALPQGHNPYVLPMVLGVTVGLLQRVVLLRWDRRVLPTQPHGEITYLFVGLVAGVVGALFAPAILTQNVTAGVFLALGAQQFHTLRDIDRRLLLALDQDELVPRGRGYVEGTALALEARNYLVIVTSLVATVSFTFLDPWLAALPSAAMVALSHVVMRGPRLRGVADAEVVDVRAEGDHISAGGVMLVPAHDPDTRRRAERSGLAIRLTPRSLRGRMILGSMGQRQAVMHDVAARLGLRNAIEISQRLGGELKPPSVDDPLLPRAVVDPDSGVLVVFMLPVLRDPRAAVEAALDTPLLELSEHPVPEGARPARA